MGTFSLDRPILPGRFLPELMGAERIYTLTLKSILLHLDSTINDQEVPTQQAKNGKNHTAHTMY